MHELLLDQLRTEAARTLSAVPRPFVRWVGSKRALLSQIVDVLPPSYSTYHEPFLGSGALFFLLRPTRAHLSDSCCELVETYKAVRDNPDAVARFLRPLTPNRELFYEIRSNRSDGRYKRAAQFIYLNKLCWNGLYRVNGDGVFNVPYGRPKTDNIFDETNLQACANTLSAGNIALASSDFELALEAVGQNDLVFLDPPYVTKHNNNGFIEYNETIFSWHDQNRLAELARELLARGAHVIVANAHHNEVSALYPDFNVTVLNRPSTLAADATKRGTVREVLFWQHSEVNDSG